MYYSVKLVLKPSLNWKMESWQEQHINQNLKELIENTRCSIGLKCSLKGKQIISTEEDENLVS